MFLKKNVTPYVKSKHNATLVWNKNVIHQLTFSQKSD